MRQAPINYARPNRQGPGHVKALSCLHREAGLAAVAAELNLQVHALDREEAEAVRRGAAALFLAGYGPYTSRSRRNAGTDWNAVGAGRREKATKARLS
jgi:hypothetical protein